MDLRDLLISDNDIAMEFEIDSTYEPDEDYSENKLVPANSTSLVTISNSTGPNNDIIKKGAVAAAILAAAGSATAGIVKIVKNKKLRDSGYSVNAKKSRQLFQEWKNDPEKPRR
jgi:hypothetical protein